MGRVSRALYAALAELHGLTNKPTGGIFERLENITPTEAQKWALEIGREARELRNANSRNLRAALEAALEPVGLHSGGYMRENEALARLPKVAERVKRRRDELYDVDFALQRHRNLLWLALQASAGGGSNSNERERLASARFDAMETVEKGLEDLRMKIGNVLHGFDDEDDAA